MHRWVSGLCFTATFATVFGAITEHDILEWSGVLIASGASIFAWGLGRYHTYRRQRRLEDHEDRVRFLDDILTHAKMLQEMENRQNDLRKAMDTLTIEIRRTNEGTKSET